MSMEDSLNALVQRLDELSKQRSERLVIGIAGIPGSGKTTYAHKLAKKLNERSSEPERAILVGMDGWHYSRAELDKFPDPVEAHARRGAPHTFNSPSFISFLKSLHEESDGSVYAPAFHHERKDPDFDAIEIKPSHRIVVVEGIYLAMGAPAPWGEAAEQFDEIHLLDIDLGVARERITKRHVQTGLAEDEAGGLKRADENDLPNGRFMLERVYKDQLTSVIKSVNEDGFAT